MPGSPKQPGRHPHDAAYKSLFASRRTVADTLRGALRDLAASLDFSTLERLPASFVTEHLRQRQADWLDTCLGIGIFSSSCRRSMRRCCRQRTFCR